MSPAETPVLRAHALTVRYGSTTVVRDVDLTVHHGDGVAVLGRNGAGKSSLLRALARLQHAEGVVHCPAATRRPAGLAFVAQISGGSHSARWDLPLSVTDVVAFGLMHRRRWRPLRTMTARQAISDALRKVGLQEAARVPIGELSGGQRQRVLLARALVQQPEALLLDEPFAGLDAEQRECQERTLDEVAELVDAGRQRHLTLDLQARVRDKLVEVDPRMQDLATLGDGLVRVIDARCDSLITASARPLGHPPPAERGITAS